MIEALPSVSVVIPCYNSAPFVARAIESAINQSVVPVEIICVNDGSTDETLWVLQELVGEFPNLITVIGESHRGGAAARNTGLAVASGEYVQFLDADDELLPTKLQFQLRLGAGYGKFEADIVAGVFMWFGMVKMPCLCGPKYLNPWANLISSNLGVTSANLWRRDALNAVGGWNEGQESSQEYELMFRMMKRGARVVMSYEPLTKKIDEPGCLTALTGKPSERRQKNIFAFIMLRVAIAEYMQEAGLMTNDIEDIYYALVHHKTKSLYPYMPQRALELHRQIIPSGYLLINTDGGRVAASDDLLCVSQPYDVDDANNRTANL